MESADGRREKSALICEKRNRWVHADRRRLKYADGRRKKISVNLREINQRKSAREKDQKKDGFTQIGAD